MLSGQLAPSSANFVPRPRYFIEDDQNTTSDEQHYKTERQEPIIRTTTATANSTTPYTIEQPTSSTTILFPEETSEFCFETTATTATAASTIAVSNNTTTTETHGRSAALERAYVHDVYENCEEPAGPIRPRVAQFLANLDPGSIVCDVGCGNGRYLTSCNPLICTIGIDRCYRLTKVAREKGGEVALCDNLELPFRDESFDAVLSLAVVHHFATTERRVGAIRELARILRIGGRVIISVWALEQKHRRFESQDVLIPWQPPKNRNINYSDEEDEDDYLPPYHAYTEDSTNSSRSAGDGDSSSLSSSSPGESCYSFVRRAIQKLAGGRKHPWFLDSWNSKDAKNDSSLEYEDAKDLPIELRRLEDFEDYPDPPLSAGLKSRSLGSILNPPPRQIVRSRSSVPSLGAQLPESKPPALSSQQSSSLGIHNISSSSLSNPILHQDLCTASLLTTASSTLGINTLNASTSTLSGTTYSGRRPKLIKQKQSLCDDEYQLPDNPFHMIGNNCINNSNSNVNNSKTNCNDSKILLRKQSSLNEELMAENRLREKERVRKRIQKQMSLNEAFLCRSLFSKRLQIIREGFTTKLKTSTGSLERVTKNGFVKIMQNFKPQTNSTSTNLDHMNEQQSNLNKSSTKAASNCTGDNNITTNNCSGTNNSSNCNNNNNNINSNSNSNSNTNNNNNNNSINNGSEDQKPRRHSRESGSDSSKDSSLQSDTSIESEDSFASVIFVPKSEQQQQQQNSNTCNNNSSRNGTNNNNNNNNNSNNNNNNNINNSTNNSINRKSKIPSVPTSPLIMPCPPTPAHSPAATTTITSVTTNCSTILSSQNYGITKSPAFSTPTSTSSASNCLLQGNDKSLTNRFTFDDDHIKEQESQQLPKYNVLSSTTNIISSSSSSIVNPIKLSTARQQIKSVQSTIMQKPLQQQKITRQIIKDLPQIPKFRKQQSLQQQTSTNKTSFPIVRRSSAAPSVPKLMSLEIYNPETDDLDSDSSEPSSPDSIDSVINALKPDTTTEEKPEYLNKFQQSLHHSQEQQATTSLSSKLELNPAELSNELLVKIQNLEFQQYNDEQDQRLSPTTTTGNNLIDHNDSKTFSNNILNNDNNKNDDNTLCRQHLVDFAEKLSAQLLKELDDSNSTTNKYDIYRRSLSLTDDISSNTINNENCSINILHTKTTTDDTSKSSFKNNDIDDPYIKKLNGEIRDLNSLREELRERRLMLANLTTNTSMTGTSSSSSSASSLSATKMKQNEENNDDDNDNDNDDPHRLRKFQFLRNFCSDRGDRHHRYQKHFNITPDTTYLIPENDDSSIEDNDEIDLEHDVIIEEDEDQFDDDDDVCSNHIPLIEQNIPTKHSQSQKQEQTQLLEQSEINDGDQQQQREQQHLDSRPSTESWGHSNSTTSLDSPSQGGGSTTHHRYYHVFREGELDALINHHVASLHIVSSYYERASWCVVAEKVQVWTI